jgi:hypothetical protein
MTQSLAMAGAAGDSPGTPGQPDTPDDVGQRFSEIEAELFSTRTGPREPSAEERARKPGKKAGLASARKARKLRKPVAQPRPVPLPDDWRLGPARQRKPSTRGKITLLVIAVIVIAGLAAAGIELHKLPGIGNTAAKNGATPASQPPASARPAASFLPSPTPAAPFLGTPAQSFADGAAGIVIPPAQPAGSYSAAQVAAAYQATKTILVAANLSLPTLYGGTPYAFARLLVPQQRTQFLDGLDKTGYSSSGLLTSTRAWVTSFAPGTRLDGPVIKVHGTIQATTGTEDGVKVLRIEANYLFVYAVTELGAPSSLMRVVVHDAGAIDFAAFDDPGGPLQALWQIANTRAGVLCDEADGYLHPQFPNGPQGKVRPSGAPVNPYDPNAPLAKGCRPTTGT